MLINFVLNHKFVQNNAFSKNQNINLIGNIMRPSSAITKINQNTSTRSIWKKYQSIRPEKNQFYCFKTITQILQGHQYKPLKQSKNQLYYHKINSPRKYAKDLSFKQLTKQTKKRISTAALQRNPNIKKTLTNNFFSSKQIGKQNHDRNSQTFNKIKTQVELKSTQPKFLPYRQQTFSIIKQSKILNQVQNQNQSQLRQDQFSTKNNKSQKNLKNSRNQLLNHEQCKNMNKRMALRHKQKTKHIIQHSKTQKQNVSQIQKRQKEDWIKIDKKNKKKEEQYQEFAINEWQNGTFQQDNLTFSMLLNGRRNK